MSHKGLVKCTEAPGLSSPSQLRFYDVLLIKGERPEETQSELLDQGANTISAGSSY